ncbi:hypothetical protein [Ancylobacter sp. TS-1]|nr:hypothetical protein [Ancylobacter sp. TS-1]
MSDRTRSTLYVIGLGVVAVVVGAFVSGNGEVLTGLLPWSK